MSELAYQFETDPRAGVPKLFPVVGAGGRLAPRDVQQLEDALRTKYEALVRDGHGTVTVGGRVLAVRKKPGDTSRQPTLEVFVGAEPSAAPVPPARADAPADWCAGWLGECRELLASDRVLPVERAVLGVVLDELRALGASAPPGARALVLLTAVVHLADQLSRGGPTDRPQPYPIALGGLERLLGADATTPWGKLPAGAGAGAPPSWVARLWQKLTG